MTKDSTIKLQRNLLGSIDLTNITSEKEETEQEKKDYCAAVFAIFPRLQKKIKQMMHAQLMFSSFEADTWERVIFGRGTFNGLSLMLEELQQAHDQHISNTKPKEEFDKANPLGEL